MELTSITEWQRLHLCPPPLSTRQLAPQLCRLHRPPRLPGHVRKLLHGLGFSVPRPRRVLARADAEEQDRWHRRAYPNLKRKPRRGSGR